MDAIETGEVMYRRLTGPLVLRPALAMARLTGQPAPTGDELAPDATIAAVVNHGRWLAACPFCPSAQHAFESDRRFLCTECLNAAVGGRLVAVTWPDDETRTGIEAALLARARPENRNWLPGETVDDLHRETAAALAAEQEQTAPPSGSDDVEARLAALERELAALRALRG